MSRADETEDDVQKRNRVRRHGMFMLDVEIFDELGLPEKLGRKVFRQLDKPRTGRQPFPQPVKLMGGRRFWPAVKRYFMTEFGGEGLTELSSIVPDWEENFGETPQTRGSGNPRSHLAAAK